MIRVFVADDHPIFRNGVIRLIDGEEDMCVVGESDDGATVLAGVEESRCDVLVLDLSLPNVRGIVLLEALRTSESKVHTVVLSMYPEDELSLSLIRGGASSYINKGRDPLELLSAIRCAATGESYLTDTLAGLSVQQRGNAKAPHEGLTSREHQVFTLLVEGKNVGAVADSLAMSPSTTSNHVAALKRKLGADSISDIVRYAARIGLL